MPLLRRLSASNTPFKPFDHSDWRIYFYFISQLAGGSGLTALLLTMLWPTKKRKPRNPLLISLCFSWWVSTFPCLCLLYYARQITGPPPTYAVCLASASLTMGQDILVGTTAPALLFNIWLIVKTAVGTRFSDDVWIARTTFLCLVVPYVLFVAFALAALGVGLAKPAIVRRALFYCIVDDTRLTLALGAMGTIAMVAAIILEVWTVVLLYRNRASIRQLSRDGHISLVVRVCVFGVYLFLGLCLNIISTMDWTNPVPDLFFSTFSIAVFAVFGTQRDIWRMWREASRHLTSSFSPSSSQHHQPSPPRTSFLPFGPRPRFGREQLQTSQRHLSLSRVDFLESAEHAHSHVQSQSQSYGQEQWNRHSERPAISLPLPALLRSRANTPTNTRSTHTRPHSTHTRPHSTHTRPQSTHTRPPTIVISTPDLTNTNESEPPTPTVESCYPTPTVGEEVGSCYAASAKSCYPPESEYETASEAGGSREPGSGVGMPGRGEMGMGMGMRRTPSFEIVLETPPPIPPFDTYSDSPAPSEPYQCPQPSQQPSMWRAREGRARSEGHTAEYDTSGSSYSYPPTLPGVGAGAGDGAVAGAGAGGSGSGRSRWSMFNFRRSRVQARTGLGVEGMGRHEGIASGDSRMMDSRRASSGYGPGMGQELSVPEGLGAMSPWPWVVDDEGDEEEEGEVSVGEELGANPTIVGPTPSSRLSVAPAASQDVAPVQSQDVAPAQSLDVRLSAPPRDRSRSPVWVQGEHGLVRVWNAL